MSGRQRVLLIATQTHTVWGGIELWIDALSDRMSLSGWRVVAGLAVGRKHSRADAFREAHPQLASVEMDARVGSEYARVAAVQRAIERTGADLVIPSGIAAVYGAVRQLKARGSLTRLLVPVLSQHPGSLQTVLGEWDIVDAVVANNRLSERYLRERSPFPERIHYVFQGTPAPVRQHTPGSGPLRVAFVGRFEESTKRVSDIARLLDALGPVDGELVLELFGDGPDREAVLSGIAGRAAWHGHRPKSDLYESVYPSLDALVLFSPAEGSPNVIYEAMHHGVVPVTSRFLGLNAEEVVREGINALTFAPGDVRTAASHLRRLAGDRQLLGRLGAQAAADVRGRTEAAMLDQWEALIERTLDNPPSKPRRRVDIARAGTLDRLLGRRVAHGVRRMLGKRYPHVDGWDEWPGSNGLSATQREQVEASLRELDAPMRAASTRGK